MSGQISSTDTIEASEGPYSIANETITWLNTTPKTTLTTCGTHPNGVATVLFVTNASNSSNLCTPNNYTVSRCSLIQIGVSNFNGTSINVSYTYTYSGVAFKVINDTSTEIAEVTDWFGIIIVISAMVVLILLTVIIISAIRGTGLVGLGGESKPPRDTA